MTINKPKINLKLKNFNQNKKSIVPYMNKIPLKIQTNREE